MQNNVEGNSSCSNARQSSYNTISPLCQTGRADYDTNSPLLKASQADNNKNSSPSANYNIAIGSDHRGRELKNILKNHLASCGHIMMDFTPNSQTVDYPDVAESVCKTVSVGRCRFGILICGTGVGMTMAANKVKGIRAANCVNVEIAKMSRMHNNANVLCLGADFVDDKIAKQIIAVWLATEFDGMKPEGERHCRRVRKIGEMESSSDLC